MSSSVKDRIRVALVNLGCAKNRVDSEVIETILVERGFTVPHKGPLDAVILNTCGFINEAKEESLGEIFRFVELKKKGKVGKIIVGGCLSQRYMGELKRAIPEVDRFIGISDILRVGKIVREVIHGREDESDDDSVTSLEEGYRKRLSKIDSGWTYLKVADGCQNICAYCAIPNIRGPLKSREVKKITLEFREMVERGIKEINLIGQDIGSLGKDRGESGGLEALLEEFSIWAPEDVWIRLLYLHPVNISEGLVEIIRESPFIVHYLDIPVQHGSNRILKKMNRRYSREFLEDLFSMLRERLDDLVIRTTVMVGFPGEEQRDFDQLLDLVECVRFDRLGGFLYSREEDTPAWEMSPQVKRDKAISRLEEILTVQSQISLEKNHLLKGRKVKVLVEEVDKGEKRITGRYYGQAPEVDGIVSAKSSHSARKSDFVTVKITDFDHYDLFGSVMP